MPIYEFECIAHGSFELTRPMAQVRDPAPCPECGNHGKRLLSAPNLATGSAVSRRISGINERNKHEPRIVTRETAKSTGEPVKRTVQVASGGYPWAIGH